MTSQEFTTHIKNLIAKNDLKLALEQMQLFLAHSPRLNEVIIQSARLENLNAKIHEGTLRFEEADIEENKIQMALLHLLDHITAHGIDAKLDEELTTVEQANKTIIQNAEKIYNIDHIDNANFS